jgi:hypothetical protein
VTGILDLFSLRTYAQILERGLSLATSAQLPVTSWQPGDPTRSLYNFVTDALTIREDYTVESIKSGFLDNASGKWLQVLAKQLYGVDFVAASYSTPTITLRNDGGGRYTPDAGDLTFKASSTGATFHTTDAGTGPLAPGATVTYALVSDGTGSGFTVAPNEIDEIVTTLLEVVIVSSTAAAANDDQEDEPLREQCRATLGALSPNGPPDAYEYVVRNHTLTGESTIAKAKAYPNSSLGRVATYVAGSAGIVAGAAVTAAQAAVERWATPLCITPTVYAATARPITVVASVTGNDLPAGYASAAATAIAALISIYGIAPKVTRSALSACLQALAESGGATDVSVNLTAPAADVVCATGETATLGSVTVT